MKPILKNVGMWLCLLGISAVWFWMGIHAERRKHVCKNYDKGYDKGYRDGVRFTVDAVLATNVFEGTLGVTNGATISNCIFVIRPTVTAIQLEGGASNITVTGNQFWQDSR